MLCFPFYRGPAGLKRVVEDRSSGEVYVQQALLEVEGSMISA